MPASAAFPTFIAAVGALLVIRPALDPDLWVHIRTGAVIVATHAIPRTDTFSFSLAGAPWADFEWLWELGLTAVYAIGGSAGLVLGNALLVAATAWLVQFRLRIAGAAPAIAACGAGLTLFNIVTYAGVRPGMTGLLFDAGFLAVLELARTRGWRWLLILPPAEIVWANAHGSYASGPLLCAIYGLAAAWEDFDGERDPRAAARAVLPWAGLSLGLIGAAALNPMGFGLLRFTLGAGHLAFNRRYVGEWRPPDFNDSSDLPLLATLAATLTLALLARGARPSKREALLLIAGTIGALESAQFLPLYAVASAPVLAGMLQRVIRRPLATSVSWPALGAMTACLAALAGIAGQWMAPAGVAAATAQHYPVGAVQYIEAQHLEGPVWNEFSWGSYLIANLPRVPVFVDGRAEMYGDPFLLRYVDVMAGRSEPDPVLDSYGINFVLIPPDAALATVLRHESGWREAYDDGVASVFVRSQA
jgi:hypothetical protein